MFSMPTHFFTNLNKYVNIILPVGFNYVFFKFSIDDVSTNERRRRKQNQCACLKYNCINKSITADVFVYIQPLLNH